MNNLKNSLETVKEILRDSIIHAGGIEQLGIVADILEDEGKTEAAETVRKTLSEVTHPGALWLDSNVLEVVNVAMLALRGKPSDIREIYECDLEIV